MDIPKSCIMCYYSKAYIDNLHCNMYNKSVKTDIKIYNTYSCPLNNNKKEMKYNG